MKKPEKLRLEEYILGVLMMIIFVVMAVNIIGRYVFNTSLTFVDEATTFLFGCACFIGAPIACFRGINIGMDALIIFLPVKAKKAFIWWVTALSLALYVVLLYQGVDLVRSQIVNKTATPAMNTPVWLFSLAVPFSAALYLLRCVQYSLKCSRELDSGKPANKEGSE
ncbi:MAG: TRAP transporter small permease [Oscillospiraceae bacterium]|nr:TRAP transporter small permease [Oscillospiraceae bacterium]